MTQNSWGMYVLIAVVAAFMVVPTSTASFSGTSVQGPGPAVLSGSPAPAAGPPAALGHTSAASPILDTLRAQHIPMRDVFLPNFNSHPTSSGAIVSPGYTTAPAPMGLGYFGVQQVNGKNVGTISYTRSVEGSATLNSVSPFYLASSSPDIFTMQLNTVLTHVTVLGNTSGQYWIQNVPIYTAGTQTLGIEDNIWNFSSPTAGMQTGTLYSYSGNLVAPTFYYAIGPTWHMPTPFTIHLYNNATVFNHRPTVYFNYSITASNGSVISGSFDRVEFNSALVPHPHTNAAKPTFQINGKAVNPLGLLNDAEIMLGGPGGGTTTTLNNINASMRLWTLPNGTHTYQPVPAGYSFGTDTGETSEGIAVWGTAGPNHAAMLGPGPSLLQPLWGLVGAHAGYIQEIFHLTPSNAFVFASAGSSFVAGTAAWAPVPTSGYAIYRLTPGTYSFKFLLSDFKPTTLTLSGNSAIPVPLVADSSLGIYTPLWAWNNAQLAAISQPGGLGTNANPYVLVNNVVGPVDPLFGEFNDFYFPVFPGLLIANTNAHVTINGAPSFPVAYSLPFEAGFSARFGTPFSNNLQYQFYNVTHLSLVNTAQITGWFFFQDSFIENVLFWNSSWNLIAGNNFQVQSVALIMFGGSHNTVWGNTFTAATTTATTQASILNGFSQNAFQLYETGDVVYNNAFMTPVTAVTPGFNFYTGAPSSWHDTWNLPMQSAANVHVVNGFNLTGSIVGGTYQGGNEWANYGTASDPFSVIPYNNGGGITSHGDYVPLTPFALFSVTFHETSLPAGTHWSVTLNGITMSTHGTTLTFRDPNGTYAFVVAHVTGHTATPSRGAVVVNGAWVPVAITWT